MAASVSDVERPLRAGSFSAQESAAAFYKLFYGDGAIDMDRVYQLMSQQAQFWSDSWEQGPSSRKPIFGYSAGIYNPRKSVKDPTITLPAAPGPDLTFDTNSIGMNLRRVELGAALPQQRRLFAFAFSQQDQLPTHPLLFGLFTDCLLQLHQAALAGLNGPLGHFLIEGKCA